MIPKKIHYCWFGGNPLPELALKCIESWKKYCPDYEIIEWNETNFDVNCCQYVKEAYESKKWAFVSDYARLYAMYNHGGIYMDTDVELVGSIDKFLSEAAFTGYENKKSIITGIMGSEKHSEWIGYLMSYYADRHFIKEDGSFDVTTNVATITRMTEEKYNVTADGIMKKIDGVLTIYPQDYFCPKDYVTKEIVLTDNTIAIHHFDGSWHSAEERYADNLKKVFVKTFKTKYATYPAQFITWCKFRGIIPTVKMIIKKKMR